MSDVETLAQHEADRTTHVGGSDVAAIIGLSPWGSPWSVWAEKAGLGKARIDNQERLDLGLDAESFLAAAFSRHHPHLYLGGAQAELLHPEYPWLRGHADGFVLERRDADIGSAIAGWEAKTDSSFQPWTEIPAYYACQAQLYMLLTGLPEWWFTVGFARWQVKHYILPADLTDQQLIIDATRRFWYDHCLTGVAPDVDAHQATTEALKAVYPGDIELDAVEGDKEAAMWQAHIVANKERIKVCEGIIAGYENLIRAALGDHTTLTHGTDDKGRPIVVATLTSQDRHSIDADALRADLPDVADKYTKTTTSRVLRVKQPKGK